MRRRSAEPGEVRQDPGSQTHGPELRRAVEKALRVPSVREAMDAVMATLGSKDCAFPPEALAAARKVVCEEYDIEVDPDIGQGLPTDRRSRYFANLWQTVLEEAHDPESQLPTWLREGTPVGWKGPLVPNGVFPEVDGDTASVEKSRMIGEMDAAFSWGNYKSFHEAGEHAKAEVKRVVDAGFVQAFDNWEEATAALGDDVVVNRLGCVVKTKANGEIKARLVTDLRRSGGNGRCKVRERIVLPRVLDLVHSVLRMLRHWGCTSFVELVAIDFSDAFHTLFLQQQERPLCMFEADGKVHCYNRLSFGLASAPLLWGGLAAAGFRICQSTARVHEFDAHCYVDDPGLVVAGGSTHTRRRSLATLLLLLLILGFDISWTKAQHGQKIEWLGVCVELTWHEDRPAVRSRSRPQRSKTC